MNIDQVLRNELTPQHRRFIDAEIKRVELTGRGATGARKREFAARLESAQKAHGLLDILADYVAENEAAISRGR